jgi:hypothetical protein
VTDTLSRRQLDKLTTSDGVINRSDDVAMTDDCTTNDP